MHAERVERHQRGADQTMNDLRLGFTKLSDDHDKVVEQFHTNMIKFEAIFIGATKSAKLVSPEITYYLFFN